MPKYSDHQLRLAAKLYYVDGLSQTEVSKYVNVSQAHVSRLLALAQESGIVRISVEEYDPRDSEAEDALKKRFKLKAAVVVKSYPNMPPVNLRLAVGRFAVQSVVGLLPANATVAVSGGRTLRDLIVQITPESRPLKAVLQAMGNLDSNITPVDSQELGRLLASHYQSPFYSLSSPAYMTDRKSRDLFLQLDQIRGMRERFNEVDVALVGIGNLSNSMFIERGILTKKDLQQLAKAGAVGEVCGRFFDENGRECPTVWRERVIAIEKEQLRKIPNVIAVISGADRALALRGAIRGGIVNSIAIDDMGAAALLAQ